MLKKKIKLLFVIVLNPDFKDFRLQDHGQRLTISALYVVIVEKNKYTFSPDRLLGDVRTGDTDGVREDEYGLCRSLSIVEAEPTK